ncbi:MAG: DUF177 domain-containing protein [Sandaracinaceae bacterium]
MAEYVLKVKDIHEAGRALDLPVRGDWLSAALTDTDVRPAPMAPEGRVALWVQRQGADIVVTGTVSAALAIDCSRCLEEARFEAQAELTALLTARGPHHRPEPDEVELTPEDLDREFFDGEQIVLDDLVREHLLLEVPIQPLCREDCAGIALGTPAARPEAPAVDPRLAPLLKLVGRLPTEE